MGDINGLTNGSSISLLFRKGYVHHPLCCTTSKEYACLSQGACRTWHDFSPPYLYGFLPILRPETFVGNPVKLRLIFSFAGRCFWSNICSASAKGKIKLIGDVDLSILSGFWSVCKYYDYSELHTSKTLSSCYIGGYSSTNSNIIL